LLGYLLQHSNPVTFGVAADLAGTPLLRAISPERIDWASPGMLVAYQMTS